MAVKFYLQLLGSYNLILFGCYWIAVALLILFFFYSDLVGMPAPSTVGM
jgi:hypothetical protein